MVGRARRRHRAAIRDLEVARGLRPARLHPQRHDQISDCRVIIYAETNFLLELAYLQESYESCAELLDLAKSGTVSLVLPAFTLIEARLTWDRRNSELNALQNQLQPLIRQLARSEPFRTLPESSRELISALAA